MSSIFSNSRIIQLLFGRQESSTKLAIVLAVGLFVAHSGFGLLNAFVSYDTMPAILYLIQRPFLIEGNIHVSIEIEQPLSGYIVMVGFAGVQAYFNEGYLPSLLLTTAPIYGAYIITVPGPITGLVIWITTDGVFAPHWAALHVFPNTIAFGTIGFLLGVTIRYFIPPHRVATSLVNDR